MHVGEIVSKAYGSRTYRPGDENALVELYNAVTGRSRSVRAHRWEWLETPEGQGSIWIIEKTDSGEIVGHHGLIPIRFSYFGQSMLLGKTENTMVHPQHRGKVLYLLYEKEFVEEAKDRFDLLYTTDGVGTAGRVRLRLGYTPVGQYARYVKACKKSSLDQLTTAIIRTRLNSKLAAKIAIPFSWMMNHLLIMLFSSHRPIDPAVHIRKADSTEGIEEALDSLWGRSKSKFGITISRSARYLQWRVFDNPNLTYEFLVATKGNEVVGYAVVEHRREGMAQIVDLVADGNDGRLLEAILRRVVEKLNEAGIQVVTFHTLLSNNTLNLSLRRNGFRSFSSILRLLRRFTKTEEAVLLTKALNESLDQERISDPENWYYTAFFLEGLYHPPSLNISSSEVS